MTLELETIPCLADNYAFLVHDRKSGVTALFDAPESWPIQSELERHGRKLTHLFITHHHSDHIDGVAELVEAYNPLVIGAARDAHRLPKLDVALAPGDTYDLEGREVQVLDAAGHTTGHVAYYLPRLGAAFTGDSLMALGCGRVFEGTMPQMWESLTKLAVLPPDTLVCSGHEYTQSNARFAETIEPGNEALMAYVRKIDELRAKGIPTVPTSLERELATNPFLRADVPALQAAMGHPGDAVATFAEIRGRKDRF